MIHFRRATTVLSLAVLILLATSGARAQQTPSPERMEQALERLDEIKVRLALTPEQTEQVKPVLQKQMEQFKALQAKNAGDDSRRSRLKMMREAKKIRGETDEKLKTILSKQQMNELNKIREEQREGMKARRKA